MADPTPTPSSTVDPGYTTTEFWQTLFFHLVAATVAIGSLFGAHFNLDGMQSIVPAVAIAAAAIAQAAYSRSRATVKAAAAAAAAPTAPINASAHTANETPAQVDGQRMDTPTPAPHNDQSSTSVEILPSLLRAPTPDSAVTRTEQTELLANICVLLRRIYQAVMAIQKPPV